MIQGGEVCLGYLSKILAAVEGSGELDLCGYNISAINFEDQVRAEVYLVYVAEMLMGALFSDFDWTD